MVFRVIIARCEFHGICVRVVHEHEINWLPARVIGRKWTISVVPIFFFLLSYDCISLPYVLFYLAAQVHQIYRWSIPWKWEIIFKWVKRLPLVWFVGQCVTATATTYLCTYGNWFFFRHRCPSIKIMNSIPTMNCRLIFSSCSKSIASRPSHHQIPNNQFSLHWISNDIEIRYWAQTSISNNATYQPLVTAFKCISFEFNEFFWRIFSLGIVFGLMIVPSRIMCSVCAAAISIKA